MKSDARQKFQKAFRDSPDQLTKQERAAKTLGVSWNSFARAALEFALSSPTIARRAQQFEEELPNKRTRK